MNKRPPRIPPEIKKTLAAIITDAVKQPASLQPVACSICQTIPQRTSIFWVAGAEGIEKETGAIPPAVNHLQDLLWYGDEGNARLKKCPRCGQLYLFEYEHETLVGHSEEGITIERCGQPAAVKYLDDHLTGFTFKRIIKQGKAWVVSYKNDPTD